MRLILALPWVGIGLALYCAILLLSIPMPVALHGALPTVVLVAALAAGSGALLAPRLQRPTQAGLGVLFVVVMAVFGLSLKSIWNDLATTQWFTLGLIPHNDAADFFQSAHDLLRQGSFQTAHGRPAHVALLAALFHATGLNLQASVALLTGAGAVGCWLASAMVWRQLGLGAAAMLAASLFAFALPHVGSVATETSGFIAGTVAFVALWEAARSLRPMWFHVGMTALSVAICLRVGVPFLLPAMLAWAGLHFRRNHAFGVRTPLIAALIVAAVFAGHGALGKRIVSSTGGSFANAPDIIYSLVSRGKESMGLYSESQVLDNARWLQIFKDHPELRGMKGKRQVDRKWEIVVDDLTEHPFALAIGSLLEWNKYFFSAKILNFWQNPVLRAIMLIFLVIGMVAVIKRRHEPLASLILWGNLGIFLSVPLHIGGGERVYAAGTAFTAALVAYGFWFAASYFAAPKDPGTPVAERAVLPAIGAAGLALGLAVIAYGVLHAGNSYSMKPPPPTCRAGDRAGVAVLAAGSLIRIDADDRHHEFSGLAVRHADLLAAGRQRPDVKILRRVAPVIENHPRSLTILLAFDLIDGATRLVFLPRAGLPPLGRLIVFCRPASGAGIATRVRVLGATGGATLAPPK